MTTHIQQDATSITTDTSFQSSEIGEMITTQQQRHHQHQQQRQRLQRQIKIQITPATEAQEKYEVSEEDALQTETGTKTRTIRAARTLGATGLVRGEVHEPEVESEPSKASRDE